MEVLRLFRHWRQVAVDIFVAAKTIVVVVKWGDEAGARQLIKRQKQQVSLEEPEDLILEPTEYQLKYGDWRTNNLGHRPVTMGDVSGIYVPGAKVWRVKRARIMESELNEVVDNGMLQLGQGALLLRLLCHSRNAVVR